MMDPLHGLVVRHHADRPRGTLPLGSPLGVPLRLHYSIAVALPVFAWLAASRMQGAVLLASAVGTPLATPWAWGGMLAAGLVVALGLHELAHVAAARIAGGRVRAITLVLLGGCGELEGVRGVGAQVAVALAGPVASVAGGLACQLASLSLSSGHLDLRFALSLLGQVQVALGALELVPAPPLDGGRILMAMLARRRGSARAAQRAAQVGRLLAGASALAGVLLPSPLPVALAAVLWAGAEHTARGHRADERLGAVTVRSLAVAAPIVDGGESAADLALRMHRERASRFLVAEGSRLAGLVSADDVARVPQAERAVTPVRALAREAPVLEAGGGAQRARALLRTAGVRALAVVDDGVVVGLLTESALDDAEELAGLATT